MLMLPWQPIFDRTGVFPENRKLIFAIKKRQISSPNVLTFLAHISALLLVLISIRSICYLAIKTLLPRDMTPSLRVWTSKKTFTSLDIISILQVSLP